MKTLENFDVKTMNYELGVLLFQALSGHEKASKIKGDYDFEGNTLYLFKSLKSLVDVSFLKDGFIAEAFNYDISKDEAVQYFDRTLNDLMSE